MKYSKYDGTIEALLEKCPEEINGKWKEEQYKKDEVICYQGEIYDFFYIILEGKVNISIIAENGKKYSQAIYGASNFFGELEIFDRKPYISSIEAITDVRLIKLPRDDFFYWLREDRDFSIYITKVICDNYYELSKQSSRNILYSLKYRICNYILYSYDNRGEEEFHLDKEQISKIFAVTSRSVNRILRELVDKNIIELIDNKIRIIDLDGLREEERLSKND